MSTPVSTSQTTTALDATVLDITDRLPEQVAAETVEEPPARPYAEVEVLAVQDRWAMLLMTVVGIAGTIIFGASFWALGLPQAGADGVGATAGVGVLIAACLLVTGIGASALREDFARFTATR